MRRHPRVQLQPRRQVSGRSWLRAATGIAGRRSERRRQAGREGGRCAPCKWVASVVDTAQAERLRVSLRVAREGRCVCVGRVTRHQHITQPPCARKHRHATRCSFPCNLQFILSKLETAIANYIAQILQQPQRGALNFPFPRQARAGTQQICSQGVGGRGEQDACKPQSRTVFRLQYTKPHTAPLVCQQKGGQKGTVSR